MKIVPSLLAEKFEDFITILRQAESFTDYVQIDITDGKLVGSRSFPTEMITSVKTTLSFEVHLMTEDPLAHLAKIDHPGLKKAIFHIESGADHFEVIKKIKERGLAAGLAIKPETRIAEFRECAAAVGTLLFLTVDPGKYGNTFKPEVLEKVAQARRMFPDKEIGVDGGVSTGNLDMFYTIGVDYACVGSRIFLRGSPEQNYKAFIQKLEELKRA